MKNMKKMLALILALAMAFTLAACSSSSSSSDTTDTEASSDASEDTTDTADTEEASSERVEVDADLDYSSCDLSGYTIGYVTINSSAPWGGLIGTSFAEYAESVGATVNSLDANTDADVVTEYCQQMIDAGVDALVVFGGDIDANAETAQACYEAGIPMFLAALDVAESGRDYVTAVVGPDQESAFADIAAYVVEQLGTEEEYTVVQISGVPFLEDYIEREAGFQNYIADYSNYDMSTEVAYAYSSRTDAKTYMEQFIAANSDIDILIGYDDDLTMGGVQAIEEAGLTDQIKVYSFTGQADAIQAVIDGEMELTVMNRATDIGAALVTTIAEYFETGSVEYYQRTELTYITSENAADYLDLAEF